MEENTSINWKIVIPTLLNVLINLIISFSGFDAIVLCPAEAVFAVILLHKYHRYPDKQGKNELLPFFIAAVFLKFAGFTLDLQYTEPAGAEITSIVFVLAAAVLFYTFNRKYDISYNKALFAALTVNIAVLSMNGAEMLLELVLLGILYIGDII